MMSRFSSSRAGKAMLGASSLLLGSCAAPPPSSGGTFVASSPAIQPEVLNDPAEPLNRKIFAFNRVLLTGVIDPVARVYETIIPRPVRTSVRNFTDNISYPGRLVNESLQGRWGDAGDDSLRFLTNSTVGVAGIFDVASRWEMPKPKADFGQTFQTWGWKPQNYVMLPLLGPSDETNTLGTIADRAAEPWNYDPLLRRISFGASFNRITSSSGELVRIIQSEPDAYESSKIAWTYLNRVDSPDWTPTGPSDSSTLQTLGVASLRFSDPGFLRKGLSLSARIPTTGKRLPFNCWIQGDHSPLVFVNPGLGSHRLSMTTLAVAESLYQNGFSVVTTTSVFHPEFMERASTAELPGHPVTDGTDLLLAFTAINGALEHRYPGRFKNRSLVGLSMGGYQALLLEAKQSRRSSDLIRFDRSVAINPPVDLEFGVRCIDRFHNAPLAWPEQDRQRRVNNAAHKVASFASGPPTGLTGPPFSSIEAQYLIGLSFRNTLRDAIFCAHQRNPDKVLPQLSSTLGRNQIYSSLMALSYIDYVEQMLFPYYETKGFTKTQFREFVSLKPSASALRSADSIRVITNQNDFLLAPGSLDWLRKTLGPSRISVLPQGGHLGNLSSPDFKETLNSVLSDLK